MVLAGHLAADAPLSDPPAADHRAAGLIGAALGGIKAVGLHMAKFAQTLRHILDLFGNQVDHQSLALQLAGHAQQPPANHRAAVSVINPRPDHHIADPGFILQRQENHPRCGAGPLPGDHQATDRNPAPGMGQISMRRQARHPGAQHFHRMRAQAQAQRQIILDHLFAQCHARQRHRWLCHHLALQQARKQRQGPRACNRAHLPQRIAAQKAKCCKGIALGQPFQRIAAKPCALPQALHIGITIAARRRNPHAIVFTQALDLAKPQPQCQPPIGARLQRVVPPAVVHRHLPHLDPVITRIAHNLGRRIKPHRLRVQQRTGKGRRMVAFHPCRCIDQQRKAGSMAFGKAVFAKAFDLGKTSVGKIGLIATLQHAAHEPVAEGGYGAHPFERRQAAAQTVRLARIKARGDNGNLHGLFLKQRHTQRAAQHAFQFRRRKFRFFLALAAVDIGVHHAALNGAGAHNRHLDHQIIEFARQHAGQKIHLRPAFDLKHANRISPAQHVIHRRVFLWHGLQRQAGATLMRDHIKAFADAGQHPQRQNIHLQEAQRINIVLVPFNHRAAFHRGVFNRAHLVQPPLGDDKAADMLRQMARKADDLGDQLQGLGQAAIRRVQPYFAQLGRIGGRGGPPPALPRDHRQHILTKPHHLTHLADGGAGSEMDDRGGQPGPVTAIFGIDVLDHLFAAFMFEIHVNIRRLAACF